MIFKLYFNDLNDETKARYLKFQGVASADDLNHEVEPLAILETEPSAFDGLEPGLVPCTFTSVWDNGTEITTKATYDPRTGWVEAETSDDNPGSNALVREFISTGKIELDVCTTCHEYVVVGKCQNPDCESRA